MGRNSGDGAIELEKEWGLPHLPRSTGATGSAWCQPGLGLCPQGAPRQNQPRTRDPLTGMRTWDLWRGEAAGRPRDFQHGVVTGSQPWGVWVRIWEVDP